VADRKVIEPVLMKYAEIIQDDDFDFMSTDVKQGPAENPDDF